MKKGYARQVARNNIPKFHAKEILTRKIHAARKTPFPHNGPSLILLLLLFLIILNGRFGGLNEGSGKENEQTLGNFSSAEKDYVETENVLQVQKSKNTQHSKNGLRVYICAIKNIPANEFDPSFSTVPTW